MKNYGAKDVDEYIASAPEEVRPKLGEVRKIIRSAVPKAEEKISGVCRSTGITAPLLDLPHSRTTLALVWVWPGSRPKTVKRLKKRDT